MGNEKIEKMLYEAQNNLPTTTLEWPVSEMVEKQVKKRRFHMNKVVAACVAFVMFLGIGGITALANIEIDIDSSDYSQWSDIRSGQGTWNKCEKWMRKRGFVVPENLGDCKYTKCYAMLVAKHGDTYWDALTKNVYNPISIEYVYESSNQSEDESWIDVTLGTLDEAYWSAYFGFENVDGKWMYVDSEKIFEYREMILFGKTRSYNVSGEAMNWKWIDEKNGICWSITVPVDKEIDSLDVVKTIIDLNI